MITSVLPLPPRRRNLQALKATLSTLRPDAQMTAIFRSARYGTYAIRGTVVRSDANGGLLLGGEALDTASSTPAPKKYPDELKAQAVRLYLESDPKPTIRKLAQQLGVHHEALRNWIRQADTGQ
ncbi:transposase [Nocardia fusca]|uniref:transposase n=1 Tax=Nocardia fusca TaxID=941183 RepID=UPI0037C9D1D1